MVTYLKDHGVQFYYDTKVVDVQFSLEPGKAGGGHHGRP